MSVSYTCLLDFRLVVVHTQSLDHHVFSAVVTRACPLQRHLDTCPLAVDASHHVHNFVCFSHWLFVVLQYIQSVCSFGVLQLFLQSLGEVVHGVGSIVLEDPA